MEPTPPAEEKQAPSTDQPAASAETPLPPETETTENNTHSLHDALPIDGRYQQA